MNSHEFVSYMIDPLTYEQMNLLYKANDIKYEKCNLYYDIIKSLNKLVVDTYLGDEYIRNENEKIEHFNWCFNKVLDNLKKEKIIFDNTNDIKDYFFFFYDELFYKDKEKNTDKIDNLPELSFSYYRLKSRSDIDIMVELYKMFEKSLNEKLKNR
jgi:hypothetical protein